VAHHTPVSGLFQWMPNSAHEAKRLRAEIVQFTGLVKTLCMDSKADDHNLYTVLRCHHGMQLLTPRRGMDKTPARQKMSQQLQTKRNRRVYQHRATMVEPLQGLLKALFDLETG
jgi:hypothetical protein